ncbi:hypothetical protein [Sinomicrobium soli]|uniref:hypothetical protein n=1 Tax=Sinomicrobium sp. N-1-3-6 TaxID=2219864 RepID=UPI000DCF3B17|nr:hypothetical protein [Sinomicrobium sp. N-1-3-6]RAV28415.1 hypothetical protein DN748_13605 [Sinomicrobium sp. N-1-3-6]
MESFSFNFQNPKAARYLVGGLLVSFVLIGIVVASDFINAVDSEFLSIAVFLAAMLLPLGTGIYLMITKGKARDRITLTDDALNSEYFGRIPYAEISKVYDANIFTAPPPSLKMRLKTGKKIMWPLSDQSSLYNSKEDLQVFLQFKEALSGKLEKFYETRQQAPVTTPATHSGPAGTAPVQTVQADTPDRQLKKNIAKSKKGTWAIPLSLALGLLALARTCGSDWVKKDQPDFYKMHQQSEELHDHYLQRARGILQERLQTEGRLFLYSNDPEARLGLLPPVYYDNPTGIETFEYNNAINDLRNFVQHPDSVGLSLILSDGYGDSRELKGTVWDYSASGNKALFLRIYDPEHRIKPRYNSNITDSTDYPVLEHMWKVPVTDSISPDQSLETSLPGFNMLLSMVRHNAPSCKLYLAAREKDGVTAERFREAVHILNRALHHVQADTTAFTLKTIDNGGDLFF